jgi:hypothetical protein
MATIINKFDFTFTPEEQQAISNAAANAGVDKVLTGKNPRDGGNDTLYDLYDEDENFLFTIDRDGCVIYN